MTNILAIDLATKITGLVTGTETKIYGTMIEKATNRQHMADKLRRYTSIKEVDVVVIEDIYLDKNPQTLKQLARMQGAVEDQAQSHLKQVLYAKTAEIDKACGISIGLERKERKEATRRVAEALLPGREMTEDECDAVALMVWAQGKVKEMNWNEQG